MLGRADEGLCPAILKRQLHYGMEIGIIHHMTELNTSRLFSEQNDSWGREQRGTRSLCESQRPATSHPMEHFSSWGREQCGTRPL